MLTGPAALLSVIALLAAAPKVSLLVMPLEALAGVEPDLARQLTTVLVAEASRVHGVTVQSYREIQGALSQEQLKQAMGCDSASCAAELAGALNTDQIIIGSLGYVGQSFMLSLSRITAGGQTVGRTITRYPRTDEEALMDGVPEVVRELMGDLLVPKPDPEPVKVDPPRPAPEPTAASSQVPPPKEQPPKPDVLKPEVPKPETTKPETPKPEPAPPAEPVRPKVTLTKPPKAGQQLPSDNGTQAYIWVPPGNLMLGCPDKDRCADDDAPPHSAQLPGFWLNRTEVTVKSYQACVDAGECKDTRKRDTPALTCNLAHGRQDHPMNCVSYAEALDYCEWEGGRIPTSDEWEFAARNGKAVRYPWGTGPLNARRANFCDRQCQQAKAPKKPVKKAVKGKAAPPTPEEKERAADGKLDDRFLHTAPVGSFAAGNTAWGLQDMAGNVREWSSTSFESSGGREVIKGVTLPGFLSGGPKAQHELLGGGFQSRSSGLAVFARGLSSPTEWREGVGFRCMKMTPRL